MLEAVDDEAILGFFREDFGRDVLSAVEVRRNCTLLGLSLPMFCWRMGKRYHDFTGSYRHDLPPQGWLLDIG